MDIRIPNLGDGISSGLVVTILVNEGDTVQKDQTIIELETDKAVAPIPAPQAGAIGSITVKNGDTVAVGQVIAIYAGGKAKTTSSSTTDSPSTQDQPVQEAPVVEVAPQAAASPTTLTGSIRTQAYQPVSGAPAPTSPSIRKMALQLGIDLGRIQGSGRGGRILLEDVQSYIATVQQRAFQPSPEQKAADTASTPTAVVKESIDFSKWGPVKKEALTSLRKTIARNLLESWQSIPHVTQQISCDITAMMALRKKHKDAYAKKKANLTVTVFVMKALVSVLKKYPLFNSSLDLNTNEIIYKNYYHQGIAVDTPSGLMVPVIRDVDKKSMRDLSIELMEIAEKARQRKISIDELRGASFTISNLGGLGGTYFTPIVNQSEVAILGLGKASLEPRYINGKLEPRLIMPLSVSYDHRVIDGADGARFITALSAALDAFDEKELKG